MVENEGFQTKAEAQKWLSENDITPHHLSNTEIQLVPTALNDIPHSGSAAQMRNEDNNKGGCK